jgi:hypothetical protein
MRPITSANLLPSPTRSRRSHETAATAMLREEFAPFDFTLAL